MKKIMFVCHGNICRSPMAEFVFLDMVEKRGLSTAFEAASAATSTEELGSPVHPGTRRKLQANGIPLRPHSAVQLTRSDYAAYDYLLGMDSRNLANMRRILGEDRQAKVSRLMDFTPAPRDIADPWYTGNFEATYRDVTEGCQALLDFFMSEDQTLTQRLR